MSLLKAITADDHRWAQMLETYYMLKVLVTAFMWYQLLLWLVDFHCCCGANDWGVCTISVVFPGKGI